MKENNHPNLRSFNQLLTEGFLKPVIDVKECDYNCFRNYNDNIQIVFVDTTDYLIQEIIENFYISDQYKNLVLFDSSHGEYVEEYDTELTNKVFAVYSLNPI